LHFESRYIEQLFQAYADRAKRPITEINGLKALPRLKEHFLRQRVAFYHAESLRIFARDSVPLGTFESLQQCGKVWRRPSRPEPGAPPDEITPLPAFGWQSHGRHAEFRHVQAFANGR
jgi:hypothetical protein